MLKLTTSTCGFLFAATVFAGQAFAVAPQAPAQAPAHRAFAQPSDGGTACMNNARLASHVAYLPVDPGQTIPCGHLLSTDTVLTVHHWDKT